MRKIITLSGFAGSGKSTIAKELFKIYNFELISTGQFVREIVKNKYNNDLYLFEEICKKNL